MNTGTYTPDLALPDPNVVKLGSCEKSSELANQLINAFRSDRGDLSCLATTPGERSVFAFLMTGQVSMTLTEREMTPFESVPYKKLINSPPFALKVAICAPLPAGELSASASVYVHRSNPLPGITMRQLSQIFTRGNLQGDYSSWSQVDRTSPLASASIQPLRLPDIAPLSVFLTRHHFEQRQPGWNGEYVSNTDALITTLGNMPAGIGIAESGWDNQLIRAVPISDGSGNLVSATIAEMQNGRYPLTRYLYLYLPKEVAGKLSKPLAEFAHFVLSPSGKKIISAHLRYAPLSDEMSTLQSNLMVSC